MGIRFEDLREYLLSLPGVTEGTAYRGPIFRVKRKMIARLREDRTTVVLHMDGALRDELIASLPSVFFIEDHYRSYPLVLVRLGNADLDGLKVLIEQAYEQLKSPRKTRRE